MSELIYDIGMDDGDDTDFYCRKGFRVVAVEADPDLCEQATMRFASEIADGRITVINRAIVETPGPVTLYRSTTQGWATVVETYHHDNVARGVAADSLTVSGITLSQLIDDHGEPFYMKLDIEGMDRAALRSLAATGVRPPYLSIETAFARNPRMAAIRLDFAMLRRLGYDRFKIVDQAAVPRQVAPCPPRVGKYVPYSFSDGASGLFGEEAPGDWQSAEAALTAFQDRCRENWFSLLLYRNIRIFIYYSRIMHRLTGRTKNLDWYDIHAKHGSVD